MSSLKALIVKNVTQAIMAGDDYAPSQNQRSSRRGRGGGFYRGGGHRGNYRSGNICNRSHKRRYEDSYQDQQPHSRGHHSNSQSHGQQEQSSGHQAESSGQSSPKRARVSVTLEQVMEKLNTITDRLDRVEHAQVELSNDLQLIGKNCEKTVTECRKTKDKLHQVENEVAVLGDEINKELGEVKNSSQCILDVMNRMELIPDPGEGDKRGDSSDTDELLKDSP